MICEIIGTYHGDKDLVQVAAILQENDGESLHEQIKTASVSLLHNDVPMLNQKLEPRDYNEGERQFMVFFIHPPTQKNMYLFFQVELQDGRTAKVKKALYDRLNLPYKDIGTNPQLAGLPAKDHTNTWDGLNRERKPD